MFKLGALPKHITIVGGGYMATEFAGIMSGLGTKVTLVYRGDCLLKKLDKDISNHLQE